MRRFIDGEDRMQQTLLPHCLEDYVGEENPVRVIEVFIEELDLAALGFSGVTPATTGRPGYHPSTLLKIYLYGYLNRLQSSRRLEREAQRNIELMWLVGRLAPGFSAIADFRKGQWRGDPGGVSSVCGALPPAGLVHPSGGCHRRQQVQSGEQSRQELHGGQGHRADGAGRRQHRALPEGARPVRPRRKRCRRGQVGPVEGEDCQPAPADAGSAGEGADGSGRTDQQVSLTDPDARSMATSGKGTATVGYNVQIAVDA